MTAIILDGRAVSADIRAQLGARMERLAQAGKLPHLVALRSDVDPAAALYTRSQAQACAKAGIRFSEETVLSAEASARVLDRIDRLNRDVQVTGIVLVKPFGPAVDFTTLCARIHPGKDVEGVHPRNAGLLGQSTDVLPPCTAEAAIELALSTGFRFQGQHVVVVGAGEAVGKPVALMALQRWATTTICHVYTQDLNHYTRQADCLFVAAGVPGLIRRDSVKPDAVVIDIGINRVEEDGPDGSRRRVTVGDVDFDEVREIASHLTPVPGGVGPVTVAVLLRNTVTAAERLGTRPPLA